MKACIQLLVLLLLVSIFTNTCAAEQPEVKPGTLPNMLQTIEAAAEDIIAYAPSRNWGKINRDVTDMESAWNSHQPQASEDGASHWNNSIEGSNLLFLHYKGELLSFAYTQEMWYN